MRGNPAGVAPLAVEVLVFMAVLLAAAYLDWRRGAARSALARLMGAAGPESRAPAAQRPRGSALRALLGRMRGVASALDPGSREALDRRLEWARHPLGLGPDEFFTLRVVAAAAGGLGGVALLSGEGWMAVLGLGGGALLGWALPEMWLSGRIEARQQEIRRELIGFVDLLATATEAGLTLAQAVERVSALHGGALGEEFRRAFAEIAAGQPRQQALEAMAERTGVEDLRLLVGNLVRAERYGTEVSVVLRQQASELKARRHSRAVAEAHRAGVRMMGPVVLFIFVPLLVVLLGPAVIALMQALGSHG